MSTSVAWWESKTPWWSLQRMACVIGNSHCIQGIHYKTIFLMVFSRFVSTPFWKHMNILKDSRAVWHILLERRGWSTHYCFLDIAGRIKMLDMKILLQHMLTIKTSDYNVFPSSSLHWYIPYFVHLEQISIGVGILLQKIYLHTFSSKRDSNTVYRTTTITFSIVVHGQKPFVICKSKDSPEDLHF